MNRDYQEQLVNTVVAIWEQDSSDAFGKQKQAADDAQKAAQKEMDDAVQNALDQKKTQEDTDKVLQQVLASAQAAQAGATLAPAPTPAPTPTAEPAPSQTPVRIIRVELYDASSKQTVNGNFTEDQANGLVQVLSKVGKVTG